MTRIESNKNEIKTKEKKMKQNKTKEYRGEKITITKRNSDHKCQNAK